MHSSIIAGLAVVAVVGLLCLGCGSSLPPLPGSSATGLSDGARSSDGLVVASAPAAPSQSSSKIVDDARAIGRVLSISVGMLQNEQGLFYGTTIIDPNDPLAYPSGFPRYKLVEGYDYSALSQPDPNNSIWLTVCQDDPNSEDGSIYLAIRCASTLSSDVPGTSPLARLTPPEPIRGKDDGLAVFATIVFEEKPSPFTWQWVPFVYTAAQGGNAMMAMYAMGVDAHTAYFYRLPHSVPFRLVADPGTYSPDDPNFITYQVPDPAFLDSTVPYSFAGYGSTTGSCFLVWFNMTSPDPDPNHGGDYPMFRNTNDPYNPSYPAGPGWASGDIFEVGVAFSIKKRIVSEE